MLAGETAAASRKRGPRQVQHVADGRDVTGAERGEDRGSGVAFRVVALTSCPFFRRSLVSRRLIAHPPAHQRAEGAPCRQCDVETREKIAIVTIDRPEVRNAVDGPTAAELADAFRRFEADDALSVAILTGANGTFLRRRDLKAVSQGATADRGTATDRWVRAACRCLRRWSPRSKAGPSRAGRARGVVISASPRATRPSASTAGAGLPLCDGGTIRLPRLIGQSHALDMILTRRGVSGDEALRMGREPSHRAGHALDGASSSMRSGIASFPQRCMRNDRRSAYEQ